MEYSSLYGHRVYPYRGKDGPLSSQTTIFVPVDTCLRGPTTSCNKKPFPRVITVFLTGEGKLNRNSCLRPTDVINSNNK